LLGKQFNFFVSGKASEVLQQKLFFVWLIWIVNSFPSNNYCVTSLLSRRHLGEKCQYDMESEI